jgi:hypothetical protein
MRLLFCLVLLSTFAFTQATASGNAASQASATANAPANSAASNSQAQAGAVVPAILSKSVDSKKAKAGDEISARTTQEIRTANNVVIPKDSKLLGKVTHASARNKGDVNSNLGIVFDRAELKGGKTMSLTSTIQALIAPAPPQPISDDSGAMSGSSASSSGGYGSPNSGGTLGGIGSTAGSAVGGVGHTAGSAVGSVSNTADSAVGVATPIAGSDVNITSNTMGVVGLKDLELTSSSGAEANGSVISSNDKSVKLDSGTRLLIHVTAANPAAKQAK